MRRSKQDQLPELRSREDSKTPASIRMRKFSNDAEVFVRILCGRTSVEDVIQFDTADGF
jgi:hypothetical protein